MSKLFAGTKGVLLVQVEIPKCVVDDPVVGLVRPEHKHENKDNEVTLKGQVKQRKRMPDCQYDVPHQGLVRELPIVDCNLRSREGAKKKCCKQQGDEEIDPQIHPHRPIVEVHRTTLIWMWYILKIAKYDLALEPYLIF